MEAAGYIRFWGHYRRYNVETVGESYLYKVPGNKRGNLKPFRGNTIRIVCVGHKRFYRGIMAGQIAFDICS